MQQAPVGTVEFISRHRDFGWIYVKDRPKLYFRMADAPPTIQVKDSVTFRVTPGGKHDMAVDIVIVTMIPLAA